MTPPPSLDLEKDLFNNKGYKIIAGTDEVGRGCVAGPVVAAAVILPLNHTISGIRDSKALSPERREIISKEIYKQALSIGIGLCTSQEIDRMNILEASREAMRKALHLLTP